MMDIRTARLWDIILDGILPVNWPQKPKRTQKQNSNKYTKHPFKHATFFTHATKHAHIHTTCDRLEMTLNYYRSLFHSAQFSNVFDTFYSDSRINFYVIFPSFQSFSL